MKKILLSTVLAASSWVLFAQDTTNQNTQTNQQTNTSTNMTTPTNQMNTTSSTSNYNAYGIPNYVQMNFQTRYPNVSNLTWTAPTADWYHGYYSDNAGRYTHVYYSTDPYYNVQYYPDRIVGYTVSLPVLQTWVPESVITTATNQYKHNLYDIAAMKGNKNIDMYVVRVLDNGEMKSMYMDASGAAVTDFIRVEEVEDTTTTTADVNMQTTTDENAAMNNNTDVKTKTKIKNADGTEMKTKTKEGKTKTKVDD